MAVDDSGITSANPGVWIWQKLRLASALFWISVINQSSGFTVYCPTNEPVFHGLVEAFLEPKGSLD